jgi:superfamily II DNA/RNA helicase
MSDVETLVKFKDLGISKPFLTQALDYFNFNYATPVQVLCIPKALNGSNLIVQAKNGTGKTLAFALSCLELLDSQNSDLQVIILTSTREVASQIYDFINEMTFSSESPIFSLLCCGGYSRRDTIKAFQQGVQILIGTVGRVKDLTQKIIPINSVKLLILDEADKICSDLEALFSKLSKTCQFLAFSATYTQGTEQFLVNKIEKAEILKVSGDDTKLKKLQEFYVSCADDFKKKLLKVLEILNTVPFHQCIIFHNFKVHGSDLASLLRDHGFASLNISSDLSQEQRIEVMRNLRFFKIKVMLSTDIASRGIDVLNLNLVINFDFPVCKEVYVHRVGRAGRFGSPGVSVTICTQDNQVFQLNEFSVVRHFDSFDKGCYQIKSISNEEDFIEEPQMDGWVDVEPQESPELKFTYPVSFDQLKEIFCEFCSVDGIGDHCHCEVCRENYSFIKKYLI